MNVKETGPLAATGRVKRPEEAGTLKTIDLSPEVAPCLPPNPTIPRCPESQPTRAISSAWYDDRTNGPLATSTKPRFFANRPSSSNSAGGR